MLPMFYLGERYSEQRGKRRKKCLKKIGSVCGEPNGGDTVRSKELLQGSRRMSSTELIFEPRRQCPHQQQIKAEPRGGDCACPRLWGKVRVPGTQRVLRLRKEAREMGHGSRGGCLVSQGACVRHSADETGAGGQCWRPKGAAEMPGDKCHESPHERWCWPGLGRDGSNHRKSPHPGGTCFRGKSHQLCNGLNVGDEGKTVVQDDA